MEEDFVYIVVFGGGWGFSVDSMYILCDFRKTEIYDAFTLLFKNSVEIC